MARASIARILTSTLIFSILFVRPSLSYEPASAAPDAGSVERASLSTSGEQGDGDSLLPSLSADGRFLAFVSRASNLAGGDTNDSYDVFVHDLQTGATERVSVSSSDEEGDSDSEGQPSISADGRFVAFSSEASNLVGGDTNGREDVFVHDRETGVTERVSVSSSGVQGDDASRSASISADGRLLAFLSFATNLVGGDTNGLADIFVHDRETGVTERVSVSSSGEQANLSSDYPFISGNGRFVAFSSYASNLVSGDTNDTADIFVHDRETGVTERVSVSSLGEQGNGLSLETSISADGRFVAFVSHATNLIGRDSNDAADIFVHDRQTGVTRRVSVSSTGRQANRPSSGPFISADGRFVGFYSLASNLVTGDNNGDQDSFVHDRLTGVTERVSVSSSGEQGNDLSGAISISAGGRFVAFESEATNLVGGDTNAALDIFIHDRCPDGTCAFGAGISVFLPLTVH